MRKDYPLRGVLRMRSAAAARCEQELGSALTSVVEAQRRVEQTLQALVELDGREAKRQEDGRLSQQMARSGEELLREQSYLERLRRERVELERIVSDAQAHLLRVRERADAARRELADASAELRAIEEHHGRWLGQERRRLEAQRQEELDDQAALRGARVGAELLEGRPRRASDSVDRPRGAR